MNRIFAACLVLCLGLSLTAGCGGKKESQAERPAASKKALKSKKARMPMETYCRIQTEMAKLGVEKYLDTFRGKEYAQVKEPFDRYMKERAAIPAKYGYEEKDLLDFFYRNGPQEIEAYRKEHPEFSWKHTPEELELKRFIIENQMAWMEKR